MRSGAANNFSKAEVTFIASSANVIVWRYWDAKTSSENDDLAG